MQAVNKMAVKRKTNLLIIPPIPNAFTRLGSILAEIAHDSTLSDCSANKTPRRLKRKKPLATK